MKLENFSVNMFPGNKNNYIRRREKMKKTFYLLILLFISYIQAKEINRIGNDNLSLEINDGKAVLSYSLNGKVIAAAELQAANADIKSITEEKSDRGTVLKITYSDQTMLRVTLPEQSPFLDIEAESPVKTETSLSIAFQSKVMIIPDSLSDNYIFFHENSNKENGRIFPAFHMAVFLLNGGNAMLAYSWQNAEKVWHGWKKNQGIESEYCRVEFRGKNRLLIGLPAAKNIWTEILEKPAGNEFEKIDWLPPFTARWLINYRQKNQFPRNPVFIDESIPIPVYNPQAKGHIKLVPSFYIQKPDIWQGYEQVNGRFFYPSYLKDNQVFLRQLVYGNTVRGQIDKNWPQVVYCLDAVSESPEEIKNMLPQPHLKKLLTEDEIALMTNYDIWQGHGICSGTDEIEKLFADKKQKSDWERIKTLLREMNEFVVFVTARAKNYRDWQTDTMQILQKKSKLNPELSSSSLEIEGLLADIQVVWNTNQLIIKTPEDFLAGTVKLENLIDSGMDAEKQEEECDIIGRELRTMGGTLHHTIGNFRQIVRAARYAAVSRLAKTSNTDEADLLCEFLERSSVILRPHHGEEGK